MENDKTQKPALSKTAVSGSVILPTDLRIGNIVNLLSGEEDYYEIRSFDNEVMSFKGHISWDYIGYDEVKAIPLTEELLLKIGFVFNGWNYDFERFTFHAQGKNEKGEFYNTEFYVNRDNVKCLISFQVRHVHQLQNLYFALTGYELMGGSLTDR